jgi:hypothetical protein
MIGRKSNTLEFISRSDVVHNRKYIYSLVEYVDCFTPIKIICPIHGVFEQRPVYHLNGECGCPKCGRIKCDGNNKSNTLEFITKSNIKHENKYTYPKTVYVGKEIKVIITCDKHGDFEQTPHNHLYGKGCRECQYEELSLLERMSQDEFIRRSNIVHDFFYDYSKVIYKNNRTKVEIICPLHGSFWQRPCAHLCKHKGCIKCGNKRSNTDRTSNTPEFIMKSNIVHDNLYKYPKVGYVNDRTKVVITCDKHGDFEQTPGSHLRGYGCPTCHESGGEKEIRRILRLLGIKFKQEKTFKDLRNGKHGILRMDFYLSDYNICIEFDGPQHFGPSRINGISMEDAIKMFERTKIRDEIKNKYCKDNKMVMIRIPYWDYDEIENELSMLKAA